MELQEKKDQLKTLIETRSKAGCDTRHLSASDIQREEEIEDLEEKIQELEQKA